MTPSPVTLSRRERMPSRQSSPFACFHRELLFDTSNHDSGLDGSPDGSNPGDGAPNVMAMDVMVLGEAAASAPFLTADDESDFQ